MINFILNCFIAVYVYFKTQRLQLIVSIKCFNSYNIVCILAI